MIYEGKITIDEIMEYEEYWNKPIDDYEEFVKYYACKHHTIDDSLNMKILYRRYDKKDYGMKYKVEVPLKSYWKLFFIRSLELSFLDERNMIERYKTL